MGWLVVLALTASIGRSQVFINEILFNPPGSDTPNEYIELRATPNLVLPAGTYLVTVDGDGTANPGALKNIFDLSGRRIGGNGLLALLQKGNSYVPHSNATVLVNTGSGSGWGSGSSSSVGHRGDGLTELKNAPVTFFLIQTAQAPDFSTDIDTDNDSILDGPAYASWTVLDSVGVLGNAGIGYGAINFRKSSNAIASGTAVTLGFTPSYVGRSGNTTGSSEADWVASNNLGGLPPAWTLDTGTNTAPTRLAGAALNHIGAPNFGAPNFHGVVLYESGGSTEVNEGAGTDSYALALNTMPAGSVGITLSADPLVQISLDGESTFGSSRLVLLSNTTPKTILVRALDDNVVDTSPHPVFIRQAISSSGDAGAYPLNLLVPTVQVNVLENDWLWLTELNVNPPGTNDGAYQYFELKGSPNALLTNVYLLVVDGDVGGNPGTVDWLLNLTGARLGPSGLLVIAATNCAYSFPSSTAVLADPRLSDAGGAFGRGTLSILLLSSPGPINRGADLDAGDNGILEGLPPGTTILDCVGWTDGNTNDLVYGGVSLPPLASAIDAASRFPTNNDSRSAAAWFYGSLAGPNAGSLVFDGTLVSSNFPGGAILTPGFANNTYVSITPLMAISGVIGDPTNPEIGFVVSSTQTNASALNVTATSSNPSVVPDANLVLTAGPNGLCRLRIIPTGVGYATIRLNVQSGSLLGQTTFPYAASAMGRPNGRFHLGASDASTAFAVDSDWMFVGDDQNQTIRLFNRTLSGIPHATFDFKPQLQVGEQEKGEVDIEASTHLGNRIFWMGSHSHNNLAESRTNRTRIFATDVSGAGSNAVLSFVGMYKFLKVDLLNWDSTNGHGKGSNYYGLVASAGFMVDPKADDGSGFNFEGLTMAPASTSIGWVGFRAPLVPATNRAKALIIPILNFTNLAVSGAPEGSARFGAPIELNLGCRGIRSMEATTNGLLIVAGPPGNGRQPMARDFKLYTWSGKLNELPEEHAADLSGLNPEAIVDLPPWPWTAASQVELVSDNGNTVYYGDEIPAKHLPIPNFKKFRSDWVALGEVEVPQPCIKSITLQGPYVTLSWCSKPGLSYRVQYKARLTDSQWTDLSTTNILAVDATTVTSFLYAPEPMRFFRVTIQP